ncbi:MAG: M1 family metallopeptidase [Candidatus Acidiferrales bacterium]
MRFRIVLTFALASIALPAGYGQATASLQDQSTAAKAPVAAKQQTLSTRVVAYQIDARLDTANHTIAATETLRYRNLTGLPQQRFPFHMYLNAFQPQSTFMTEHNRDNPDFEWKKERYGAINITHLEITGAGNLTNRMQFIHPDDNNTADQTVMQIELPKPIPPGAEVEFKISFDDQLPQVVARTGYLRDFFMVGQWFPKVGVWWKGAWNCHQFHEDTEFFADFGTFDVKLTLPQNEIVGAGGDLVSTANNPDGTKTLVYHSEDVHDFSWTASPSFTDVEDSWTGSAGTVKIHILMSPGNMPSAPRYAKAVKGTLALYDQWIGPYPYDRLTVVDPPHGGVNAGGMEYPTLITADTSWNMPKGALLPELVTEHEFGHQYWYGMVATNEFEEAWLDEGINSYMEVKVMDALYGKETSMFKFRFAQLGEDDGQRLMYLLKPDMDPMTRFAWLFYNDSSYADITYGKTSAVLLTLEKLIGEETLRQALRTYFIRYRFTHPTGDDFIKTVEEVSGKDLRWYFDQAISGTEMLDYKILDAHSEPVKWYEPETEASKSGDALYRTYVSVQRKSDFVFPVDLKINFDDKTSVTEHWDGHDRWKRYVYDRKAKLVSAEIDPGHQVWLDRDLYNNSYVVESDSRATKKLSNILAFAGQWFAQLLAWLA